MSSVAPQSATPQSGAPQARTAEALLEGGSVCLQSLVYSDEEVELWLADEYEGSPCVGSNTVIYTFTDLGSSAPQSCAVTPLCMGFFASRSNASDSTPKMQKPLQGDETHIDRLRDIGKLVPGTNHPTGGGNSTHITWDPTLPLTLSADVVRVKVKSADGLGTVVLRLLAGKTDLNKITFLRPRRPSRPVDVRIGLENENSGAGRIPDAVAKEWPEYAGSNTAFTIEYPARSGTIYHCLTKSPVKIDR